MITKLKDLNINVEEKVSMRRYNSFKLDVISKSVIKVKNVDELIKTIRLMKEYQERYFVVGKGSNLLLTENANDIHFIVMAGDFTKYSIDENYIVAGPGVGIVPLSIFAAKNNLSGLEFANGIPGSIGGAITMNAGAHGSDFSHIVDTVEVLDDNLQLKTLTNSELHFMYRNSAVQKNNWIVTNVKLKMKFGQSDEILKRTKESKSYRLSTQPLKKRTCGSVFKNPKPLFAAQIIESLGLKSYEYKNTKISSVHSNFIEAGTEATSEDILHIIGLVKESAKREKNIELELEVKVV